MNPYTYRPDQGWYLISVGKGSITAPSSGLVPVDTMASYRHENRPHIFGAAAPRYRQGAAVANAETPPTWSPEMAQGSTYPLHLDRVPEGRVEVDVRNESVERPARTTPCAGHWRGRQDRSRRRRRRSVAARGRVFFFIRGGAKPHFPSPHLVLKNWKK